MKRVFPWLARWTCCAGTRDFCPAWLLWLAQYKILFLHRALLYFFYFPEFSAILAKNSAPGTEVRDYVNGCDVCCPPSRNGTHKQWWATGPNDRSSDTNLIFLLYRLIQSVDFKFPFLYWPIVSFSFKFWFFNKSIFGGAKSSNFCLGRLCRSICFKSNSLIDWPFFGLNTNFCIDPRFCWSISMSDFFINKFNFASRLPPSTYSEPTCFLNCSPHLSDQKNWAFSFHCGLCILVVGLRLFCTSTAGGYKEISSILAGQ